MIEVLFASGKHGALKESTETERALLVTIEVADRFSRQPIQELGKNHLTIYAEKRMILHTRGDEEMKLRDIREEKGISRKELAELTGISFRTLQDYEQGHKRLLSAGGETLFKLSVALCCTPESFFLEELEGGDWLPENKVSPEIINNWVYHVDQYNVDGRWITDGKKIAIAFLFHGHLHLLPITDVLINDHTQSWMPDLAIMLTEMKIEDILFNERFLELKGVND